jgi:HEAT repeat protein
MSPSHRSQTRSTPAGLASLAAAAFLWSLMPVAQAQAGTLEKSELSRLEEARQEAAQDKDAGKRKTGKGGLILPRSKRADGDAPAAKGPVTGTPTGAQDGAPKTGAASAESGRTPEIVLNELAAREQFAASEARGYAEELLAFGDEGLAAARRGLSSDSQPVLLSCARAVLLTQDTAGMGILRGRLGRELPADAIAPLLRAVDELAPESMSSNEMVALLDHPQNAMRSAVERLLSERITADDVPLLVRALSAERTDTRLRALELVTQLSGERVLELLFARLDDSRPQVAQRAAQLLAARPETDIGQRLLDLAFETPALFRQQSYALLAIVEREDLRGEAIIAPERVEVLVQNLASVSPLARGAAAVALAGIGYRDTTSAQDEWYRLQVPHELVSIVAGAEYHKDFAALQQPALHRLERITGRTLGNDGPAWQSWWINASSTFSPRRAVLPGGAAAVESLRLTWIDPQGQQVALASSRADIPIGSDVLWLDDLDAIELVATLEGSGVLSAERVPAAPRPDASERLTVAVGKAEKSFTFPAGVRPQWLQDVLGQVRSIARANSWQLLVDPSVPGARRGLFTNEALWWRQAREAEGELGERRRDRRAVELALEALVTMDASARGPVLERLIEAAHGGVLTAGDVGALLGIVESEQYHSPRTEQLVQLLLDAGRSGPGAAVDPDFGRDVFDRVYARFRGGALDSLARIADAVGIEFARELAVDGRALARALAAGILARSSAPEDVASLTQLLSVGEVDLVQEAALIAVGENDRQDLRVQVLERAERAPQRVRQAAIEALGSLQGPGALEAMVVCFADGDLELQRTALRAMGELRAPQAADLIVTMIGRGPGSPLFETARETATKMGSIVRLPLVELALNERSPGRAEAAFVLSELGASEAVPALLSLLSKQGPNADRAAEELAVLSCMDLRAREDRDLAWTSWWEGASDRDALAWLRQAQLRNGLPVAPPGSLEAGGTRDGALALVATVEAPAGVVSERARRELERILERDVAPHPAGGDTAAWRADIVASIDQRYDG